MSGKPKKKPAAEKKSVPLSGKLKSIIREKMLPAEAWDETEERLDVLEAVVKRHSREIENLKRAQ